ncbi:YihY/virulence factor BrkB family protein, partial [Nostocoides australiense]|uniref:YihY/virulence factor BrkB family protein n=1 Tax=Nostocoides australiense TaxID=99480 RepID=UPI00069D12C3
MQSLKDLWKRFSVSSVWRAWQRYSTARGSLMAGGVTYFAFFSLFPAIALGFTIFGLVLRDQPGILADVQEAIEKQLPGFIQSPDNPDGLIPLSIPSGTTLSVTALIGVLGLLWAGLGWMGALRDGIRTIFGAPGSPGNVVTAKLRDLLVLVTIGLAIVVTAVFNAATSAVAEWVSERVGLGSQTWIVTIVGLLASFLANALLVAIVLRVLSGVDLPWRAVRNGALFGGVALTLLQTFGTRLIAGTMDNKLFASIALVVGLLAFINLISRAVLLSAAWAANDVEALLASAQSQVSEGEQHKLSEGPLTREQADAEWTDRSVGGGVPRGAGGRVAAQREAAGPVAAQRS